MGTLLRPGPAASPISIASSSAHAVAGGGRAWSSRHRVSVAAFRSPSPQVLATRWRRRSDTAVRSDVVAGGAAAAAAGDSTQALSGIQLNTSKCFYRFKMEISRLLK